MFEQILGEPKVGIPDSIFERRFIGDVVAAMDSSINVTSGLDKKAGDCINFCLNGIVQQGFSADTVVDESGVSRHGITNRIDVARKNRVDKVFFPLLHFGHMLPLFFRLGRQPSPPQRRVLITETASNAG